MGWDGPFLSLLFSLSSLSFPLILYSIPCFTHYPYSIPFNVPQDSQTVSLNFILSFLLPAHIISYRSTENIFNTTLFILSIFFPIPYAHTLLMISHWNFTKT